MSLLIIMLSPPPAEGKDVTIWELQELRELVVHYVGERIAQQIITNYATDLNHVMVKDYDALYADLKALLPD